MAKSQLFKPPVVDFIINHGGRLPGAARAARRGGLHHRPHDPRPRRHRADVRRGRALPHQGARPAQARARAAGARVGRAGRAGRDPRLRARAGGASAAASRRSRSSSASRSRFGQVEHPDAASSRRRSPSRSSSACATMYEALSKPGPARRARAACARSAATAPRSRADASCPRLRLRAPYGRSAPSRGDRVIQQSVEVALDRRDADSRRFEPAASAIVPISHLHREVREEHPALLERSARPLLARVTSRGWIIRV